MKCYKQKNNLQFSDAIYEELLHGKESPMFRDLFVFSSLNGGSFIASCSSSTFDIWINKPNLIKL